MSDLAPTPPTEEPRDPLYWAIIQAIPDTITPGDDALRATARLADAVWPVVKAAYERVVAERDEARRVIRNAHEAIRAQTTAAAVALAMFDTGDAGTPSLLDERDRLRSDLNQATAVVEAALTLVEIKDDVRGGPIHTLDSPLEPERYKRWAEESLAVIDAFFDVLAAFRSSPSEGNTSNE